MNHQPFEAWLLSDEILSPEDALELEKHLGTCNHCAGLRAAWSGVMHLFEDVSDIEPPPDFMNRWRKNFSLDRQIELSNRHRWQSVIMLILIGNVIAALVFFLGTQFLTTFDTPTEVFLSLVYRMASYMSFANGFQNLTSTLFRALTSIIPAGMWAVLGAGLVGSGAIWVISLKSLSVLPRRT